jgi:hypothetical protein
MVFRRKRDVSDEAVDFGTALMAFLSTLAGMVVSAAGWLGVVGMDTLSHGAGVVADRGETFADASRARAKTAKKRGNRALLKLSLITLFLWWLDRDLSRR